MRIPLGADVYEPSAAWHVAAVLVVLSAVGVVYAAFVLDLASSSPSSTTPLIVPFVAFCAGAALLGLALLDIGVRWIRRLVVARRAA